MDGTDTNIPANVPPLGHQYRWVESGEMMQEGDQVWDWNARQWVTVTLIYRETFCGAAYVFRRLREKSEG